MIKIKASKLFICIASNISSYVNSKRKFMYKCKCNIQTVTWKKFLLIQIANKCYIQTMFNILLCITRMEESKDIIKPCTETNVNQ